MYLVRSHVPDSCTSRRREELNHTMTEGHVLRTEQERPSEGSAGARNHDRPAKSYYDLYPERKRTGPYIPKQALVAHDGGAINESRTTRSSDSGIRKSHSVAQLGPHHTDASDSHVARHPAASLQPHRSFLEGDGRPASTTRAGPSMLADSTTILGRSRSLKAAQEPVKSIDEIVRTHSANLLSVPPSQRGPQRSVSWSAFEYRPSDPQQEAQKNRTTTDELSDAESVASEDSVERETRTMLQNLRDERLNKTMSQISIGGVNPKYGRSQQHNRRRHISATPSAGRSSTSDSRVAGLPSDGGDLTRCARITVPGAPDMQVSFSDVGDKGGHPVMVFLGLGASRHLVGLYDELATTLHLRLVCIDRWGIGRTDGVPSETRTILGWSLVVDQVADVLGIDRFSVLAHSAGAPFAAAAAMMFPDRIVGPLHLLAPWTGMQQDSGYRWLRYVPDSVIKTAQVAEWMFQGWKLSKEGSRAASKTSLISMDDGIATAGRHYSHDPDRGPTPPPKDREAYTTRHAPGRRPDAMDRGADRSAGGRREEADSATRHAVDVRRSDVGYRNQESASTDMERGSALELLKASHAESARGLVDDLNLVLGKRPWGFGYADVHVACEVWHGSKDERIPLSSSINLSKEMRDCRVHVVDGASHSLMTNTEVVVEVFESIRKQGRSPRH